ncbi:ABC transporter permease subunit [Bacillus sp. FJAT-28004]|uniref:ABC transporter permease subunit n=1 Tax=Bacillus sp. FJAT-28004 TaxID=1679165 RepID=UPI0006B5ACC9|nr:ABC transporter permease subunit [Bacillus sp. FJAT-28004]
MFTFKKVRSLSAVTAPYVFIGPSKLFIIVAALRTVPKELHESALIDGVNRIRTFFGITLPVIRNFIALRSRTEIMRGTQVF